MLCYHREKKSIFISRHVVHDETIFPFHISPINQHPHDKHKSVLRHPVIVHYVFPIQPSTTTSSTTQAQTSSSGHHDTVSMVHSDNSVSIGSLTPALDSCSSQDSLILTSLHNATPQSSPSAPPLLHVQSLAQLPFSGFN